MAFYLPVGRVSFANYCGKMYSRNLFSYGGLKSCYWLTCFFSWLKVDSEEGGARHLWLTVVCQKHKGREGRVLTLEIHLNLLPFLVYTERRGKFCQHPPFKYMVLMVDWLMMTHSLGVGLLKCKGMACSWLSKVEGMGGECFWDWLTILTLSLKFSVSCIKNWCNTLHCLDASLCRPRALKKVKLKKKRNWNKIWWLASSSWVRKSSSYTYFRRLLYALKDRKLFREKKVNLFGVRELFSWLKHIVNVITVLLWVIDGKIFKRDK